MQNAGLHSRVSDSEGPDGTPEFGFHTIPGWCLMLLVQGPQFEHQFHRVYFYTKELIWLLISLKTYKQTTQKNPSKPATLYHL